MSQALREAKNAILFPAEIRFHPDLSWGEKVFMAEIQSMTEEGNLPKNTSRSLSAYFGVSHQTILNWIKKLTFLDLLEIEHQENSEKSFFLKSKKTSVK
jgi:hypothetical protein